MLRPESTQLIRTFERQCISERQRSGMRTLKDSSHTRWIICATLRYNHVTLLLINASLDWITIKKSAKFAVITQRTDQSLTILAAKVAHL